MLNVQLCTTSHFAGKEEVMLQQMCRDVLFMDVHGVLLAGENPKRRGVPLIGKQVHQKWVDMVRTVLIGAGALPPQIREALLDPPVLWKTRMRFELTTPRTRGGEMVRERDFYERVNLRLLQEVAPAFVRGLDRRGRRQIARRVRQLRRDTSRRGYIFEPVMRRLIRDLVGKDQQWMLYLTTAGNPDHVAQLLRTQSVPVSLFIRIFVTKSVGIPKSHPDFWVKIAAKAGCSPNRCVAIEDNLVMGMNAARSGMSVILLDRGYGIKGFIRDELEGRVASVGLSEVGDILPPGEQFVVCAKSIADIRLCLQGNRTFH